MKTVWRIGFRHEDCDRTPYWEYFTITGDYNKAREQIDQLFENGYNKISLEKNYVKRSERKKNDGI